MFSILNRALSWAITSFGNKFCLKMRSRLIKAINNRFCVKFMQLEIGLLQAGRDVSCQFGASSLSSMSTLTASASLSSVKALLAEEQQNI